jgi:hypothetical protein
MDAEGNLYVADNGNQTIRKIAPGGVVTTLAGLADVPGSNAGAATGEAARFNSPTGIAYDPRGFLYVADTYNHTIRRIAAGGVVTTYAGSAGLSGTADLAGIDALFTEVHENPDAAFVLGMIPHHQGAIDMSNVVLRYGADPEIRTLAEHVIADQKLEIDQMNAWIKANGISTP